MRTPFGADWEELTLDSLRTFFRTATDEGLTWEAKAGVVTAEHVRKSVCGFANTYLGGYLVLGAEYSKKTGKWSMPGVTLPGEAPLWVGSVLAAGGVDPLPSFDVQSWPVGRRVIAVVNVRPVALPPCITASGVVYERTTGATPPVRDQNALARLFERGLRARQRAETVASNAAQSISASPPVQLGSPVKIALAVAAPGTPQDISARLFRKSFGDRLWSLLKSDLRPYLGGRTDGRIGQQAIEGWNLGTGAQEEGYVARVSWDGAAAVGLVDPDLDSTLAATVADPSLLTRLWRAALGLLRGLDASGPCYVAMVFHDLRSGTTTAIRRWSNMDGPEEGEIASVVREVERTRGTGGWEPE